MTKIVNYKRFYLSISRIIHLFSSAQCIIYNSMIIYQHKRWSVVSMKIDGHVKFQKIIIYNATNSKFLRVYGQQGVSQVEDSKIVDLYWERSEQAISETQNKYGHYCLSIARKTQKKWAKNPTSNLRTYHLLLGAEKSSMVLISQYRMAQKWA